MNNPFYLILISLLVFSCSSGKEISVENQLAGAPEWVRKSPNDPFYYHGVGSALKTSQMDYREKARQNALSDIAGNISVNISSTSVLSQYEFDNKFSDYYKDNIKVSAKNYLEGYEMVESWENKERYWVYYRLSKSEYERIRNERIRAAQSRSESDYREAIQLLNGGKSSESVTGMIKALEKIRDFLGEDLQINIAGRNESYSGRLFADLTRTVQNIRIGYPVASLDVLRGQKPDPEFLNVTISDDAGKPQASVPVVVTYSWFPGKKDELTSDAAGSIRIRPGIITSVKKSEAISTSLNFEKMVRETTSDMMIRKLLSNVKLTAYNLPVNILPTTFRVTVTDQALGMEIYNARLQKEIEALLVNDGYAIASGTAETAFTIAMDPDVSRGSERSGKTVVSMKASFTVTDQSGNRVFGQSVGDITGLGSGYDDAVSDSYHALVSKIRISVLPAMYRGLFRD